MLLDVLKNSGPSILWPMTDASTQQSDVSGNGRHGSTVAGTVSYQYGRPTPDQTLLCGRTASATVGTSNRWRASGTPSQAAGQALSLFGVMMVNTTPANSAKLFGFGNIGSAGGLLFTSAGKGLCWFFAQSGSNQDYLTAENPASPGVGWAYTIGVPFSTAITVSATNVAKVYVNGAQVNFNWYDNPTDHGWGNASGTLSWRADSGQFDAGSSGDGTLGGADCTYGPLAVFGRELTAAEIAVMHREMSRGGVLLGMGGYGG